MLKVKVFRQVASDVNSDNAYAQVEKKTNTWLHTNHIVREQLVASHTNMSSHPDYTEFALTLIVNLPETPKEETPQ